MNGIELKAARLLFGLSQVEAAEELGSVSQRSWAYWENGERKIPLDVVSKIEELLHRRKETLRQVQQLGEQARQIALIFYDDPKEAGHSLLEVRYNNALAACIAFDYGAKLVKFDAQSYIDWLVDNGLIDSTQKRSEWAIHRLLQQN